jgi:hypothetical protein
LWHLWENEYDAPMAALTSLIFNETPVNRQSTIQALNQPIIQSMSNVSKANACIPYIQNVEKFEIKRKSETKRNIVSNFNISLHNLSTIAGIDTSHNTFLNRDNISTNAGIKTSHHKAQLNTREEPCL